MTAEDSGTVTKCAQSKDLSDLTVPPTADPSSLIGLPRKSDFAQAEVPIPTSILNYLDSLPEIQDQFNHVPLTSCSAVVPQPEVCTSVVISTSTSCLSAVGSGNLSHTHCSEVPVTITSTIVSEGADHTTEAMSTNPVFIPRKPAAYLTYNTLSPSSGASDPTPDLVSDGVVSETLPFHKATEQGPTSTVEPDVPPSKESTNTGTSGSNGQSDGKPDPGDESPSRETTTAGGGSVSNGQKPSDDDSDDSSDGNGLANIQSAIGALASKASAQAGTTAPTATNQPGNDQDAGDAGDVPQTTLGGGVGNLWSAIQSIASYAAGSGGSVPAASAEEITEGPTPGSAHISQQDAGNVESVDTNDINSSKGKATVSTASIATASDGLAFNFAGQTLSPGAAVVFGGSHASELPDGDGVVIDGSQTVHLSDGQATTLHESDHEPMTISRSGSVVAVNGETLSLGQQITAGQTTVSLAQSTSVLYVNGAPLTFAGPSITLGGTVYTASPGSSTSSDGLGGYIYSGIGGSTATAAHGGSHDVTESTTGVMPTSTGAGLRLVTRNWCSWIMAVLVFCFV